jgi:hypothetical protein
LLGVVTVGSNEATLPGRVRGHDGLGTVRVAVFVRNELTATAGDSGGATRTGPFRPEVW